MRTPTLSSFGLAFVAALALGCGRPSDSIKPAAKSVEEALARKAEATEPKLDPTKLDPGKTEPGKAEPGKPETGRKPLPLNPGRIDPANLPKPPELNPKAFAIEKTGEGLWRKSTMAPAALAERIGRAIREMKGTYGEAVSTVKTPTENGQVKSAMKIQDYKTYSVQTLFLSEMPSTMELRADGSKKSVSKSGGKFGKPKPLSSSGPEASMSEKQIVEKWPTGFPHLQFMGLTDGKDPWKPYILGLMSGKTGFKGEVGERKMKWKGKDVVSYRIVAKRTPEAAKRLGPCDVEMVIDGTRFLPVTIRVNLAETKGAKWNILWQAGWNFNQKFDPKEFELP